MNGGISLVARSVGGEGIYPPSLSSTNLSAVFLSQLLGVPDDLDSILVAAFTQSHPSNAGVQNDPAAIESVTFTVAADESDPAEPRILFEAAVVRDPRFVGKPSLDVRFVSNVKFGDGSPFFPHGFTSGVEFDD